MNGGVEPSGYYTNFNTPEDTISISEGGNSCGYVQYNTSPFWSGGHCYTLLNPKVDPHYLYHYLKAHEADIMKLRIGSGLPNIQKKDLAQFNVPSIDLSEQQHIARILNQISSKIAIERSMLSCYIEEKSYLLSAMFI